MSDNSKEPYCLFCGSKEYYVFNVVDQNERVIKLYMCRGCGFVFGIPPDRKKVVQEIKKNIEKQRQIKKRFDAVFKKTERSLAKRTGSQR